MDTSNAKSYMQTVAIPKAVRDPTEPREKRVARLVYQSRKRGILEMDLILSTFADRHLQGLTDQELTDYENLLEEYDWDLYYWLSGEPNAEGKILYPGEDIKAMKVFDKLIHHVRNSGPHGFYRMPELK